MMHIKQLFILLLSINIIGATGNTTITVTTKNKPPQVKKSIISPLTGYDVMKLVQDENQKKNTRKATVDMKIYDDENRERFRYFNYWIKYKKDEENSLIKFFRPKKCKRNSSINQYK